MSGMKKGGDAKDSLNKLEAELNLTATCGPAAEYPAALDSTPCAVQYPMHPAVPRSTQCLKVRTVTPQYPQ